MGGLYDDVGDFCVSNFSYQQYLYILAEEGTHCPDVIKFAVRLYLDLHQTFNPALYRSSRLTTLRPVVADRICRASVVEVVLFPLPAGPVMRIRP